MAKAPHEDRLGEHDRAQILTYSLEQLYSDQDHDWVVDSIPALLAWVPAASSSAHEARHRFVLDHMPSSGATEKRRWLLDLSWTESELAKRDPNLMKRAKRLRTGKTVQREHLTELAAYGLTLVAISLLMPGRRVKAMNIGVAPDFLFDVTPSRLRGVEAAGRSRGGWAALRKVSGGTARKPGKRAQLLARADIAEVALSLWCASPRLSLMEQVKP